MMTVLYLVTVILSSVAVSVSGVSSESADTAAKRIVSSLSLAEKVQLLYGQEFEGLSFTGVFGINKETANDSKSKKEAPFLVGTMQDGPAGPRAPAGLQTSFPSGLTLSSSWDPGLVSRVAAAMGKEFRAKGAGIALSPGLNIHRLPWGGRNFEYSVGEDPILGYYMARAMVGGLQSEKVVGCAKHFINNEAEGPGQSGRQKSDSQIDMTTEREIYLVPFEGAVDAGVGSFMCSYNLINGRYACENEETLKGLLKGDLGFEGWVMTDWWAEFGNATTGLNAGLDQCMPSQQNFDVMRSVEAGEVSEERVTDAATRIVKQMVLADLLKDPPQEQGNMSVNASSRAHQALSREAVTSSAVLLKNEEAALPLEIGGGAEEDNLKTQDEHATPLKVFIAGDAAQVAGSGSGFVAPGYRVSLGGALQAKMVERFGGAHEASLRVSVSELIIERSEVCGENQCEFQFVEPTELETETAARMAGEADVVIVSAAVGSGEGFDRSPSLTLGTGMEAFVRRVLNGRRENAKGIVVLNSPGAVRMPWLDLCDALLWTGLAGAEGTNGIIPLLLGEASPSGRLPISFPSEKDPRAWAHSEEQYPGVYDPSRGIWHVSYTEGQMFGYRYYDHLRTEGGCASLSPAEAGVSALSRELRRRGESDATTATDRGTGTLSPSPCDRPLFPFGYGLSYTTFGYSDLKVEAGGGGVSLPAQGWFSASLSSLMTGMGSLLNKMESGSENLKGGVPLSVGAGRLEGEESAALVVELKVSNTGSREGSEVVQVYLGIPPEYNRPFKVLKAFSKISLRPNESSMIRLPIAWRDLSLWSEEKREWLRLPEGENIQVMVGSSSAPEDLRLITQATVPRPSDAVTLVAARGGEKGMDR